MTAVTVNFIARGRLAWICGIVLGVVLGLVGAFTGPNVFIIVAGAAFFLFGLVMLIVSYATGGRSD